MLKSHVDPYESCGRDCRAMPNQLGNPSGDEHAECPDYEETRFTTQAGSPVVINSTGADLLDANPEDDEVCTFVQTAKVGDECTFGGGAQPAITLVRVA